MGTKTPRRNWAGADLRSTLLAGFDESRCLKPALDLAEGFGLRRPNLDLDGTNHGRARGLRRFEVQFQRFFQAGESRFLSFALAGDIDFQALGDVALPLAPSGGGEWPLHDHVL